MLHPAGLVRHIDLLNMGMPDFTMGEAISGNKNPMQASGWGAESRPVCAMKLVEMERDKLISARVLQIADEAVSNADTAFAANLLGIENCRANARWQLLQTFAGQV
jgi:hypothetical protein